MVILQPAIDIAFRINTWHATCSISVVATKITIASVITIRPRAHGRTDVRIRSFVTNSVSCTRVLTGVGGRHSGLWLRLLQLYTYIISSGEFVVAFSFLARARSCVRCTTTVYNDRVPVVAVRIVSDENSFNNLTVPVSYCARARARVIIII